MTSSGTNASCLPPDHSFDANVYTYRDFILAELGTDATTTCGSLPPVGGPQVDVLGFDGRLDEATPSATYTVNVGAGRTSARFTLNALETVRRDAPQRTFDVNMYVKAGTGASPTDFDCKADAANVFEACIFDLPAAASYSVFLQRVVGAGDYQLTATTFSAAPRSKVQQPCAKAIRDSFTTFFKAKLAAQQTCMNNVNKGKGTPPCPDAKAAAAIAKAAKNKQHELRRELYDSDKRGGARQLPGHRARCRHRGCVAEPAPIARRERREDAPALVSKRCSTPPARCINGPAGKPAPPATTACLNNSCRVCTGRIPE